MCRDFFQMNLDEFMDMDDWLMVNAYTRPSSHSDPLKPYMPVPRDDPEDPSRGVIGGKDLWWSTTGKAMKTMGFSDVEIQQRYAHWARGMKNAPKMRVKARDDGPKNPNKRPRVMRDKRGRRLN
jgi:hypothetical protein